MALLRALLIVAAAGTALLLHIPIASAWSLPKSDTHQHRIQELDISARIVSSSSSSTTRITEPTTDRRQCLMALLSATTGTTTLLTVPTAARANDATSTMDNEILIQPSADVKKFFAEARALESQGNLAAAQRLYNRIVTLQPNFVYGWSNLGNTQTALQDLAGADQSYTTAIALCQEHNRRVTSGQIAARQCNDLYLLLLNRGSLRLNYNQQWALALQDLRQADALRARPDAIVLQNLARAKELNGLYAQADRDYTTAISMTANEVNPFWLRAALIKFQLGDPQSALDLIKRVAVRFPEAPEVRAAYAVLLSAGGDAVAAQRKFLEIPDRARLKYVDTAYLTQTIAWPPAMRDELGKITQAVGDATRSVAN